jgi:hypothetical protein
MNDISIVPLRQRSIRNTYSQDTITKIMLSIVPNQSWGIFSLVTVIKRKRMVRTEGKAPSKILIQLGHKGMAEERRKGWDDQPSLPTRPLQPLAQWSDQVPRASPSRSWPSVSSFSVSNNKRGVQMRLGIVLRKNIIR